VLLAGYYRHNMTVTRSQTDEGVAGEMEGVITSLTRLEEEIRSCRKCEGILSKFGVVPRPIFRGAEGCPVMLIGQAPGPREYERHLPFQGDAGASIRALFAACGLDDFDTIVFQTSVTKCFPGRRPNSSSDRKPGAQEVRNCLGFLRRQLELLRPELILCLGELAWKSYVFFREQEEPGHCLQEFAKRSPNDLRLPDLVGKRFSWRGAAVIPMIHPSGSANGARAQYPAQDNESKRLLRDEIERLHLNRPHT
jgi:uracil-DNA glycosylase family 4